MAIGRHPARLVALLLMFTLAGHSKIADAQSVLDCPPAFSSPPLSQLIINGTVLCYASIPDTLKRGWVLSDPADIAFVDTSGPFDLFAIDYFEALEISAASEGSTPEFDKFYIVSEAVANVPPPLRPPLANEIFGPFSYGTIASPDLHVLDQATMTTILALQAASANNFMVVLEEQPGQDIFNPGVEGFSGLRFSELSGPVVKLNEVCPMFNRSGVGRGTSDIDFELITEQPNSALTGFQLLIYDADGLLMLSVDLSGISSGADSIALVSTNSVPASDPFGIVLLDPLGSTIDSAVFAPPGAALNPNLAALLDNPSEPPADVVGGKSTAWVNGEKIPRSNLGFFNSLQSCGDENALHAINEFDITVVGNDQFVEIYTDQADADGLYLVTFTQGTSGNADTVFGSVDLSALAPITPPGYLLVELPGILPTTEELALGLGLYELDTAPPVGSMLDAIRDRELEFIDYKLTTQDVGGMLPLADNELGLGNAERDSLQFCPDAASGVFADFSMPYPPTRGTENICMAPSDQGQSSVANTPNAVPDGDPVSTGTGEFYTQPEVLLDLGGPLPLRFVHRFAGFLTDDGRVASSLGPNRVHDFELYFTQPDPDTIEVVYYGGQVIRFTRDMSQPGGWRLVQPLDIPFQLFQPAGITVSFWLMDPRRNLVFEFDNLLAPGRLERIIDRNLNTLTLGYPTATSMDPDQVSDGLGRVLNLIYANNRLVEVNDGTRSLHLNYVGGVLIGITDAAGHTTQFDYDNVPGHGPQLRAETRPEGNTPRTRTFTANATVASDVDAFGGTVTFSQLAPGVMSVSDSAGSRTFVTEPIDDSTTSTVGRDGEGTQLGYDLVNRIKRITDREEGANQGVTQRGYDGPSGKPNWQSDGEGNEIHVTYLTQLQSFGAGSNEAQFSFSVPAVVTNADGSVTIRTFDAFGNVLSTQDSNGGTVSTTYNSQGLTQSITTADGGAITITRNGDGTPATITDSATGVTFFAYDALRRLIRIEPPQTTEPTQPQIHIGYNALDQIVSLTNANGSQVQVTYDDNGNPVAVTDSDGQMVHYGFDVMDQLVSFVNRVGGMIQISYDDLRRPSQVTDADAISYVFGYDLNDNLTSVSNAGESFLRTFDNEGGLIGTQSPLGISTSIERDRLGRVIAVEDGLGRRTTYGYEARGYTDEIGFPNGRRVELDTDESGLLVAASYVTESRTPIASASYGYTSGGLLDELTDPNLAVWSFAGTPEARVSSDTDPLGQTTNYIRDARGRAVQIDFPDGMSRGISYDPAGNTAQINHPGTGPALFYGYDQRNNLTTANSLSLDYNEAGDVTETTSNGISFSASYTLARRLLGVDYNNGLFQVNYLYDPVTGLVSQISDTLTGTVVQLFYDADRRLVRIERNNDTRTTLDYDAANRLIGITGTNTQTGDIYFSVDTMLDAADNITQQDMTTPLPGSDNFLNLSINSYSVDAASQIDSPGFDYDARGRRTASPSATSTWDNANRLQQLGSHSFTYNGVGDSIVHADGGQFLRQYYNAAILGRPMVAEEAVGAGFQRYYIFTPGGRPLYLIDAANGNEVHHYDFDRTGSTRVLTDSQGAVSVAYDYLPYGEQLTQMGSTPQPYTFNGQFGVRRLDAPGRYYRMGVRVYDARTASFLSREPVWPQLVDVRLLNPYQFAYQRPLSFADSDGTQPRSLDREQSERQKNTTEFTKFMLMAFGQANVPFVKSSGRDLSSGYRGLLDRRRREFVFPEELLAQTPVGGTASPDIVKSVVRVSVTPTWDNIDANLIKELAQPESEKPATPLQPPVPGQAGAQASANQRLSVCKNLKKNLSGTDKTVNPSAEAARPIVPYLSLTEMLLVNFQISRLSIGIADDNVIGIGLFSAFYRKAGLEEFFGPGVGRVPPPLELKDVKKTDDDELGDGECFL